MKKNTLKFIMLLTLMSAAFILTGCKKIELSADEFVTFTDEGFDGIGTSAAEFDYKEMLKDVKDKMKDERYSEARKILKEVTFSPKTAVDVSNGQTVTFEWDIDEDDLKRLEDECKLIVRFDDVEHTVSGLKPLEEVDVFENLTVAYDGYDTVGSLSYIYGEGYITYTADRTEGLSNGDTITVTAGLDSYFGDEYSDLGDYMANNLGQKPAAVTKEIVVSGLRELTDYDPFSSLVLKFKGLDGFGTASLSSDWSDSYYYTWEYAIDKAEDLQNGDVITVTVNDVKDSIPAEEYAATHYGLKMSGTEKQYTVEGLVSLSATVDDVDPEGLAALTEAGKDEIINMVDGWTKTDLVMIEDIGTVVEYEEDLWNADYVPFVYKIFRVKTYNDDDKEVEFFWYACSSGTYSAEGKLILDTDSFDYPTNHYTAFFGVSGEAFFGPSNKLYYVGFKTVEELNEAKFDKLALYITDNTVDEESAAAILFPEDASEGEPEGESEEETGD